MTTKTALRRLLLLAATGLWLGAASLVLAAPASADVPELWDDPDKVDKLHAILLLGGVPLLLFVVIAFLVYAPSVIRGEKILPGHAAMENQWLGGPRKSAGELANRWNTKPEAIAIRGAGSAEEDYRRGTRAGGRLRPRKRRAQIEAGRGDRDRLVGRIRIEQGPRGG